MLLGVLFGIFFPVFATFFDVLWQQLPLSLESLLWVQASNPLHWVIDTAPLFLGLFGGFVGRGEDQLRQAHEKLDQQTQQLRGLQASLEELVARQTADIERRNTQLETAAQVAREAASIHDQDQLLAETVRLISDRFGFYHAGIFLLDSSGEYAVLRAASSQGGQRMLAKGHRLQRGAGIVGYVAALGEPRIALDVGVDEVFFDNPDLPGTRSEMALPLRVRGEIIGVLDVQSSEPAAFSEDDVAVLMAMADQLAVAVSNAQLFQQAQDSLEAQRRAYGTLSREAWADLLRAEPDLSVVRDERGISVADAPWQPHMETALWADRIMPSFDGVSSLAIPLKTRGQVLGVIEAQKPEGTGHWAREEVEMLETLVERLGVTLESARLFQETQRRAARDRLLGEVTARVRETLDMESVLQTAIREIGQALNLAEVEVRMGEITTSRPTAAPASTGGNGNEENEGFPP
jgi:GAF domain-containing protein